MYAISWFVGILMSVTSFKRHCLLLMVILTQTFYQSVIDFWYDKLSLHIHILYFVSVNAALM